MVQFKPLLSSCPHQPLSCVQVTVLDICELLSRYLSPSKVQLGSKAVSSMSWSGRTSYIRDVRRVGPDLLSVQSFQSGLFNISGRPLSGFPQKTCSEFKDILQMKSSTKLVHKNFLVERSVFFLNSLDLNEVSKQLNRSIRFPCHFPTVIPSIMSPRTVNDQRTEIKDERGLWFIYFDFYTL